jgi:hypothetical protein
MRGACVLHSVLIGIVFDFLKSSVLFPSSLSLLSASAIGVQTCPARLLNRL